MKPKTPLVSIPIITYNGERFLRQQLDSIFSQTYPSIEVIAVDDCSNDGTPAVLESYRQSHNLKIVVNKQNLGYLRNFEKAVSLCSGEFIAPSDQDDIWLPEKVERQVNDIGKSSLVFSDAFLIDNDGSVFAVSAMAFSGLAPASGNLFSRLLYSSFVIGCGSLFRRELVKNALPIPQGELFHDWWFSLVASLTKGITYIPERLFYYRQHPGNTIGLRKEASTFGKLFGFIYTEPDRKTFETQVKRLTAISSAPQFNEEQKKLIREAGLFYRDRLKPGLHFRAFIMACRHHRQMFPWTRGFFRLKAVLGCFFR
jgi:glycosyltransferase involved in cell wall biosynthesis